MLNVALGIQGEVEAGEKKPHKNKNKNQPLPMAKAILTNSSLEKDGNQ